ncbi:MAG: preprotein translocase subunit YajC [Aestuariivirga sp.]
MAIFRASFALPQIIADMGVIMKFDPFLAQVAGSGPFDIFGMMIPMIGIFGVFYFFMIRPQQKRSSEHQKMLAGVQRGDTVVSGGLIGKVVKVVDDNELLVEVGPNVQVRMLRQGLSDIRSKTEPQKASKAKA